MLAWRFRKACHRVIKTVQAQVAEPEIVQGMPLGMAADFPAYVAGLV